MMESREARAVAPTASGIGLVQDLRSALLAGGSHESPERRADRMFELIEARKDEITMTLLLMMGEGDPVAYYINSALLGMRYSKDSERDELGAAPPLHPVIHLQSLRRHCSLCESEKCGRVGQYHNIVYRRGTKSGTGAELNMIVAMGGTADDNAECEVDPETGLFDLPPFEAKMALREWGEYAVRATRRWKDRQNQKGDRWKVRELRHHELYANAIIGSAGRKDVQTMAAD